MYNAKRMIIMGVILMVIGVIGPFLMVLKIISPSFWLGFLLHGASVSGLLLGTLGVFSYARKEKR
jgi:hypothetical protein